MVESSGGHGERMAAIGGTKVVHAALADNTMIAITKLEAGQFTGSSAMLSESVHSFVDTSNQGLMLLGISRSKRPADEEHPFGYGMEFYLWAFVVAILIFGLGAGISFYEGVQKLIRPHPISNFLANYGVLGLAMIFEGTGWIMALRGFNANRGKRGILASVHVSKDPTVFTVLFEDTAGLLAAFAGLLAVQVLGLHWGTRPPRSRSRRSWPRPRWGWPSGPRDFSWANQSAVWLPSRSAASSWTTRRCAPSTRSAPSISDRARSWPRSAPPSKTVSPPKRSGGP
jgi:hypothetical protein